MIAIKQIQRRFPIRLYALTLLLATPQIAHAESFSTTLWTGVVEGIGSDVSQEVIGWGLSSLGVDQSNGETQELKDINADLQSIESELAGIKADLKTLITEINVQDCENAESADALTDAVDVVENLLSNATNPGYQDLINTAEGGGTTPAFYSEIFGINATPGTPTDPYDYDDFPTSWLYRVFNGGSNGSLGDAFNDINEGITSSSGVLTVCIPPYTTSYLGNTDSDGSNAQAGPLGHPFDDLGYYSGIQTLLGFYTGRQIQATAMISEAWHLLACQAAVAAEYIDSCDFSNTSSTSPVYEICNADSDAYTNSNGTGTDTDGFIKLYCDNATTAVSNNYTTIETEMTFAGAPYSWPGTTANPRNLGIVWFASTSSSSTPVAFLAPQSLEDFIKQARPSEGESLEKDCDSSDTNPLTSEATGCGFVAGPYNENYVNTDGNEAIITYSGHEGWTYLNTDGDAQNILWPQIFETYNNSWALKCSDPSNTACQEPDVNISGSTSHDAVSLSEYMGSIGFQNAANKIIMMPHTFDTVAPFGGHYICNIFTGTRPLSGSVQRAPYCSGRADSGQTTEMQHDPDCASNCSTAPAGHLTNAIDATSLQGKTVFDYGMGFYNLAWSCSFNDCNEDGGRSVAGYWTVYADDSSLFQYRWPFLNVKENVDCSVRAAGALNASGTYFTMCGDDLKDYLDAVLPPPPTTSTMASADTTLSSSEPNLNDGANQRLLLTSFDRPSRGSHGALWNGVAVQFGRARTGDNGLNSATLRVTFADGNGQQHPPTRRHHGIENRVLILALPDGFVEGNGDTGQSDSGTGAGATWNCAVDGEISDDIQECEQDWPQDLASRHGLNKLRSGGKKAAHFDPETGELSLDVTEDVRNGINAWFIRVTGGRDLALHSREGASALGDSGLASTLIIERAGPGANTDDDSDD